MTALAVVPLNRRVAAKSRLRAALDDGEREALVRWLGERVLAALHASRVLGGVAVVSPDTGLLAMAAAHGAVALRQEGAGGLNAGLELGRRWALAGGATALLVVLGDLPLLSASEVRAMVGIGLAAGPWPQVVLAQDRRDQGTNALLLRPPGALPFAFGVGSLALHQELARARGIEPALFDSPGTRFDVDLPDDLEELRQRGLWWPGDRFRGEAAGGEAR